MEKSAEIKKILVTGACGFIGEKICSGLLKRNYIVIGTDFKSSDYNASKTGYTFVKADHTDRGVFEQLFEKEKFDTVIHCACTADNDLDSIITDEDVKHSEAYDDFLYLLAVSFGVKQFILLSTSQVYDLPKSREPIRENDKIKIVSNYGKLKYEAERKLSSVVIKGSEMVVASLRVAPVYSSNYTVNLINKILDPETNTLYVYRTGDYGFQFCCIHNLVEFVLCYVRLAVDMKFTGIFNVSDTDIVSVREIIKFARNRNTYGPALQRNLSKDVLKAKINKITNKTEQKTNYRFNDLDTFFNNNVLDGTRAKMVCTNFKWTIENTK